MVRFLGRPWRITYRRSHAPSRDCARSRPALTSKRAFWQSSSAWRTARTTRVPTSRMALRRFRRGSPSPHAQLCARRCAHHGADTSCLALRLAGSCFMAPACSGYKEADPEWNLAFACGLRRVCASIPGAGRTRSTSARCVGLGLHPRATSFTSGAKRGG